jgi:histidinol-phosphate phosphatase family protein
MGGVRRRAAFLDRDGTLNVRPAAHEYVTSPEEFVWLPGAIEGLRRLADAGYLLAVVSNQRGVARGLLSPAVLREIEQRMQRDLATRGCQITAFRYCTHDEHAGCECRKPRPGLLLSLARELDLDLASSWMIGDAESDLRAGEAAGCRTALLADGAGAPAADVVARSLALASEQIAGLG